MIDSVSPRASARGVTLIILSTTMTTFPLPVKCLGWAVEPLLDILLCAPVASSPEGAEE